MSAVFKGPFGFWLFPILNTLFPPSAPPAPPTPPTPPTPPGPEKFTITNPIWKNYKLEIPWNWMTNDTGPFVSLTWDPAKTTVYDALLQGDAVCAPANNWLDIYFNEQKIAPLHWGGSEENAKKTFNQNVKALLQSGSNTIHATGGKDYSYTSTVTFSINATLVVTYSGTAPTLIRTKKGIVEASIVI